jgi:hypothetical protein
VKNYTVKQYNKHYFEQWNAFVEKAKNATFLFHRDFMEYHSDRFEDFSLLVFDEKDNLVSVVPANRVGETVYSHQGLTYGGFVLEKKIKGNIVLEIFESVISFLKENNCKEIYIKKILSIYCFEPSNEIECFIIQQKGELYRKDLNLIIDYNKDLFISKSKLKHYKKESKRDILIKIENTFELFWDEVLIPRLTLKHDTKPVHTKEEILNLKNKFPNNIFQYNAYYENKIVAGITIFKFNNVVKSQYGATSELGEKLRALDYLFITLINEFKDQFDFFDMGTVTENNELGFNAGLLNQKQELGCSIFAQDFYKLKLND